ncbi:MAG: molybdopterin-guanine dinucleotide biosynthesis protein MobB [Streptococcaceae bacterium]|jgi:molybdopterin-guanine dinucleotide biosynthesis protein MobB|nr:molybdopterin-guanine dinucleotide biosynthesis protein MobB [Streptococcaceae bacterium]
MKILQIVGNKKVGKTTLMLEWIGLAKSEGLKVACLKRAHEAVMDTPETDSYRFAAAGADGVGLSTAGEFLWHEKRSVEVSEILEKYMAQEVDVLLIEGFRASSFDGWKLELIGPMSKERILPEGELQALRGSLFSEELAQGVEDLTSREARKALFTRLLEEK